MIEPKDILIKLALQRVLAIGQEASDLHHECVVWREKKLTDEEFEVINKKFQSTLEDQCKWIGAIMYALHRMKS